METTVVMFQISLIGNVILILLLIYSLIKMRHSRSQLNNALTTTKTALNASQEIDQELTKQVNELQSKLTRLVTDPITHLPGWQLFEDRLLQNIKESERYQLTLGVLFIDIDNFKVINDALSYDVGDALLAEVAERLQSCIRQVDSLSRFSKDTFAILLTQLSKPETAAVVAQRILQVLTGSFLIKGHELYITVGIGIAIYPTDGVDTASLLRSADHALHLAKEKGKNVYQFYQERLHTQSQRELTLYNNLSSEASLASFLVYFQPIQNMQTDEILCMDALLHWQHQELGLISADEIMLLAEKQRKLNQITEWLLKHACQQYLHWRTVGFNPAFLGIPLSIKQLENTHFIYRISQILQETEFKPEWLLFEIRESMVQVSFEVLEKAFNMLSYLGVKIAIDHFGTDAFSLIHLKDFTIHYLKLDPCLIKDIETNNKTVALVKALLNLANSLSIEFIVQGVETLPQSLALKNIGCSLLQGPFISPPIPEQDVVTEMVTLMQ